MKYIRYEESRPEHMREMIGESPIAYVPFGALEWHGEHGPLGLDGIKAHALCEAAADRTGGVVFPTVFWGAFDTMPFPYTFHFKKSGIVTLVRAMLEQLDGWAFKIIVLLTGHYPATQINMLKKECRRFNKRGGALAIGVPEQAFAHDIDYYGDHAGMWETSLMLAIRPDLINLDAMPEGIPSLERMEKWGVMGQDPIGKADAKRGLNGVNHIAANLATTVKWAMEDGDDRAFEDVYASYEQAMKPFSRNGPNMLRAALDVHSFGEFVRYVRAGIRMIRKSMGMS